MENTGIGLQWPGIQRVHGRQSPVSFSPRVGRGVGDLLIELSEQWQQLSFWRCSTQRFSGWHGANRETIGKRSGMGLCRTAVDATAVSPHAVFGRVPLRHLVPHVRRIGAGRTIPQGRGRMFLRLRPLLRRERACYGTYMQDFLFAARKSSTRHTLHPGILRESGGCIDTAEYHLVIRHRSLQGPGKIRQPAAGPTS